MSLIPKIKKCSHRGQSIHFMTSRVCKKHNSLKKANISRLKWIKPDKILCFFKGRVFSKMHHRSTSYDQFNPSSLIRLFSNGLIHLANPEEKRSISGYICVFSARISMLTFFCQLNVKIINIFSHFIILLPIFNTF